MRLARTHMHGRRIRYVFRGQTARANPALIIFLHGFGEGGSISNGLKYGPLQSDSLCPTHFTVVSPICRRFHWWNVNDLLHFVDEIAREHAVSWQRICIAGMSMGAYAVWRILTIHPRSFGAALIVSGGPKRILSTFGILHASINPAKLNDVRTPVYSMQGKYDIVASVHDTLNAHSRLKGDNHLIIYERLGHTGVMRIAFCNHHVFEWISRHIR